MAYSYVQYTGNGATVAFSIPFQYISADYLEVRVDGVLTSAYTLPSASSVQMNVAPANGAILEIRRNTPKTSRLVDFQDASILTEASLDLSADQTFHITQEAMDIAVENGAEAVATDALAANISAVAAAASAAASALSETNAAASAIAAALFNPANYQPIDGTLTALAGLDGTAGLVNQTGADTFAKIATGTASGNVPLVGTKSATEVLPGLVELATTTEAAAGTDTDRAVTAAGLEAHMNANALGWDQTWSDVKTSPGRSSGTSYQNTTGAPIQVSVGCINAVTYSQMAIEVSPDNSTWTSVGSIQNSQYYGLGSFLIVPNGWYYKYTAQSGAITHWVELR